MRTLALFDHHGTSLTVSLVEHCFKKISLGNMMNIDVEAIIEEIGSYCSLWQIDFDVCSKNISHQSWIFHFCQYNVNNKIILHKTHTEHLPRQWSDHTFIAIACRAYDSSAILRSINKIQILHNIHHLSNLTSANGRSLDIFFLK